MAPFESTPQAMSQFPYVSTLNMKILLTCNEKRRKEIPRAIHVSRMASAEPWCHRPR